MKTATLVSEGVPGIPRLPRLPGWSVLRMILGVVLLAAAGLKSYELATQPLPEGSFLTSRPLIIAVVEGEILLGLWLLSGLATRAAWAISLICFAIFTGVSAYKGILGEVSCGCFGNVHINPWVTATFDMAVTGALLVFRPESQASESIRFARSRLAGITLVILLVGGIAGYAMTTYHPVTMAGEGGFSSDGSIVLLKPNEWVGNRLPLFEHIDIGSQLAEGHWVMVLYHHDCPTCQDEVPKYEQMAYRNQTQEKGPRVALVAMPPYAPPGHDLVLPSSPATLGKLNDTKRWFLTSPTRIEIRNGIVVSASEGKSSVKAQTIQF